MDEIKLKDLKLKSPTELLSFAEEAGVENASTMRKQELMFATLKQLATNDIEIIGTGVVEVLTDLVFYGPLMRIISPGPMTSIFHPRKSVALRFAQGIPSRGIFVAQRKANATSRC